MNKTASQLASEHQRAAYESYAGPRPSFAYNARWISRDELKAMYPDPKGGAEDCQGTGDLATGAGDG